MNFTQSQQSLQFSAYINPIVLGAAAGFAVRVIKKIVTKRTESLGIVTIDHVPGSPSLRERILRNWRAPLFSLMTASVVHYFVKQKSFSHQADFLLTFLICCNSYSTSKIYRNYSEQEFESIPKRWDGDPILKKFSCPIGISVPLRPIADSTESTELYNQAHLKTWLTKNTTSPLTREIMPYWKAATGRKFIIEGVIHFRIDQLKEQEKNIGCTLDPSNSEHLEWMRTSGELLDQQIGKYLEGDIETLIKEMELIPFFLNGHGEFWSHRCSHTGNPIRHNFVPKLSDQLLKEHPDFVNICYEKSTILGLLAEKEIPKKWPLNDLEFSEENCNSNIYVENTISKQIKTALEELRHFYKR